MNGPPRLGADGRIPALLIGAWVAAGAIVVLGVGVTIWRPLAPSLGAVPDAIRYLPADHLDRVAAYHGVRYPALMVGAVIRLAVPVLLAFTPPGRRLVARVVQGVGPRHPIVAAVAVVVATLLAIELILAPLNVWLGWVHETRWGFRTDGVWGWVRDWLARIGPMLLAAGVLTALGYVVARHLPRAWSAVAALAGSVLVAVVVLVTPLVIEPLTFTHRPLDAGSLRDGALDLGGAAGIDEVLVADASRRTTRHNAYVSGLGPTRRLVLYDTLVADRPVDEVLAIVAHEVAHDLHADIPRGVALGAAGLVVAVVGLHAVLAAAVRRGRLTAISDPRGAAVALAVVVVGSFVAQPVEMAVSRRAEAAADLRAIELTGDAESAFAKHLQLALTNLSDPEPPVWHRALYRTHPTTVERLWMAEQVIDGDLDGLR